MEVEKLDVDNIIEVKLIRASLKNKPELLTIFEMLCVVASQKLNSEGEKVKKDPPIEEEEDIDNFLETDSEDEDTNCC
tara:strand:- start:194 stop:427 length:234 start_codon:yes stop_codon:yes gene_type:complete